MVQPAPLDYLQTGEDILREARRHPLSIVDGILFMGIFLGLVAAAASWAFLTQYPEGWVPFGIPLLVLLSVLYLSYIIARYLRMATSRYVLTKERAYKSYGRFRFFLTQTTYDRVTDLHVRQSFFGRIWNFGTVVVQTAGTGLSLDGVPDPFEVKNVLERARTSFIESLLEEHAPRAVRKTSEAAQAPSAPRRQRAVEVRWRGGPTPASLLTQLAGLLPVLIFLPFLGIGALAADGARPIFAIILIGFLLLVLLAAVNAIIRYKYTRYEVNTRGVVVTSGWLSRNRVETTYDKITDVTTNQGIIARLFNFGNITVNTAGSNTAPVIFAGLNDPESVKGIIDAVRAERDGGGDA